MMSKSFVPAALVATLLAAPAVAQRQPQNIQLPDVSPRAEVHQAVGMAEVSVVYFRPAVNDREVWGALVPWDQVWRTGANENTVVTFSHDVKVQGEALAAGSYGLHSIPGEDGWQVVFSHDTSAWGSFSYDEANDALRVPATAAEAPHQERLLMTFENVDVGAADLVIHWEKLRVPLRLEFDENAITLASIRDQLKGLAQFFWVGWTQAANWAMTNDVALDDAMTWIDTAIGIESRYETLSVKSQLLAKAGDEEAAAATLEQALATANAGQLHNHARGLIGQGKLEEALAVFERNVRENPDTWFVELGLARGLSALGRFEEAAAQMKISLEKAPDNQKAYVQGLVDRLEAGEDIN